MKKHLNEKKYQAASTAELSNHEDAIRQRAYTIYESRGCEPGHELDDWLLAESEVMSEEKHPIAA